MNISAIIGILLATAVLGFGALHGAVDVFVFLDLHAALVVFGGTMAATIIAYPLPTVFSLLKIFFGRIIGKRKIRFDVVIREVTILSDARLKSVQAFENVIPQLSNPFLRDAAEVLFWVESSIPKEHLRELLETRARTHFLRYMDDANIFKSLGRFPPAFGLMGTTLGMIALLQSIGSGGGQDAIGPAMAVGLVATLYGISIANLFLLPIAENLIQQSKEDQTARAMIVEGVMLIHEKFPTKFIEEKVKSYLLPSERGNSAQKGATPR